MSNSTVNDTSTTGTTQQQLPVATPDAPDSWRGMTLEELRRARGKALVRREVERATIQYNIDGIKSNVATNGVRALMFSPGTVSHLKTMDYVLLGFRITRWLMDLRGNRRRRRSWQKKSKKPLKSHFFQKKCFCFFDFIYICSPKSADFTRESI